MSDSAGFSAILGQLSKLVKDLDGEALQRVASGETKLLLVPRGSKVVTPLVLGDVADEVRHAASEAAAMKILDADSRLTPAVLKQLATELNVTLPPTLRAKAAIQLHIAQTVVADGKRLHGGV